MTVEQHEARLAAIKEAFDNSTQELKKVHQAGQSVPKTTSSAFSQPKPIASKGFIHPTKTPSLFPPSRPAKRPSDVDSSDESSGSFPPPRKAQKTSSGQSTRDTAKPWDQDHSKMKKPPRISVPGPREKPASTSNSGKNKSKVPRVSIKANIELSVEQRGVLQLVLQGQNVFFTGSAGEVTKLAILRLSDLFNRYWQVRVTQAYHFRYESQVFEVP